ncbi:MAG: hypothetical protein K8S98_02840 [Planctomycetes bacterium]|nr:hypothetical protein [Planctomycetota bacterium]
MDSSDSTSGRGAWVWLALFLGLAASLGAVAWLGPIDRARTPLILAWMAGQALWLVALARAERAPLATWAVLGGALLLRLIALTTDARLSDDVYRYLWEGELVSEGTSPWAFTADSPEFAAVRARHADLYPKVNHPDVAAVYPPLYEAALATIARGSRLLPASAFANPIERGVFGFRLALTAADLAVAAALVVLCRRRGRPGAAALAWAWSPLVALEFAGASHMDALPIALWVGGLAVLARNQKSLAGLALVGAAGAVKYLAFISTAFFAREDRSLRPLWIAALVTLASLAVFVGMDHGASGFLGGISEYTFRWETHNLVYRFVEGFFGRFAAYDEHWSDPRRLARALIAAAWLGYGAWLFLRRVEPIVASGRMIGAFLVLSPTLHPWYATWVLPFVALEPRWSWRVLLAVLPLSYWPLPGWIHDGVWREPAWLWPLLAVPFFTLRILEARRATT